MPDEPLQAGTNWQAMGLDSGCSSLAARRRKKDLLLAD